MKPILNSQFSILNFFAIVLAFLATSTFAGPVSHYGALKVCKVGTKGQLCGSNPGTTTTPVLVKGPSLYWSVNPGNSFYSSETVEWLVTEMEIGVIRAAMAIRYWKENDCPISGSGRCENKDDPGPGSALAPYAQNKDGQKALIKRIIDAAIENDIYVIVDWHSHNANNSEETGLATMFFRELATEYKDVPNIIWEIYNEPVGATSDQINSYTTTIYNAIRNANNKNLILVGSNYYSQKPYEQAQKYGASSKAETDNVGFVFHFYAGTHSYSTSSGIGQSANNAMNAGYAVFGTEWGSMNADGKGGINTSATSAWTTWMDDNNNNISNCAWQASALDETSSMFTSGTNPSNLATNRLTENGRLIKTYVSNDNRWYQKLPGTHPKSRDVVKSTKDGVPITLSSTDLGLDGNITEVSQPAFGTVTNTGNSITFTTPPNGSESDVVRFIYKVTKGNITAQSWVKINITDRRPLLPQKQPIDVSRKAPTTLAAIGNLSASNPGTGSLSFSGTNSLSDPSVGTVSVSGSNLIFTPAPSQYNTDLTEVTLNYTIQNTNGSSSATVVLRLKNSVPTLNSPTNTGCCLTGTNSKPNTAPIDIKIEQVRGADKDEDDLWFEALYLDTDNYPGTLTKVSPDHYVYTPEPNKIGRIVFLAYITDGEAVSSLGKTHLTLTGSGQTIPEHPNGITGPSSIPGYEEPPVVVKPVSISQSLGIKSLGSGRVALSFAESGFAKLDVYSLSGKNMGTLLSGHQNAGEGEVSLSKLGLQKGVYILRLRQGSQVKTLRIVN